MRWILLQRSIKYYLEQSNSDVNFIDIMDKTCKVVDMIKETATLKNLGLEPKEISLYLKLLETGEATPLELSRKTGIKRPTTYIVLQSLELKGLVVKIVRERTTLYAPHHPSKLLAEAKLHVKELESILPHLESLLIHQEKGGPKIFVLEGTQALDRAYDNAFTTKGEVLFMSTLGLSQKVFPKTFKRLDACTFSSGFRVRELVDESQEGRAYAQSVQMAYRTIRLIPRKYLPFAVDIGVFENTVLITSVHENYFFTVGLESQEIAQAMRTLYELMWNVAKKVRGQ